MSVSEVDLLVTHPASSQSQPAKRTPTISEVAANWIKGPIGTKNLILKPATLALKWIKFIYGGLSETGKVLDHSLKRVSHLFSWFDLPRKLDKLAFAVEELFATGNASLLSLADKTSKVFSRVTSLMVLGVSAVALAAKEGWMVLSPFQAELFGVMGFLGSLGLFVEKMKQIGKSIDKLSNLEVKSHKFAYESIKLVAKISTLAIATFGMITFSQGAGSVYLWAVLGATSLSLVANISAHFYGKIHGLKGAQKG